MSAYSIVVHRIVPEQTGTNQSEILPVALFGKRTSGDTESSRRFCPPGRARQKCAAGACWPAQTLGGQEERVTKC